MNIKLPDPSLVLLLGISGSGKSTFAREHFAATEIVSSDHCRALVCDNENDQSVNQEAFAILHLIAASRMAHRRLTVIDATNVQSEARAALLRLARRHRIPVVALVFDFDVEIGLQRNAVRSYRVVPPDVIQQQQYDLQQSIIALPNEGFDFIHLFSSPVELAAVIIQRKNPVTEDPKLLDPPYLLMR